MTDFFAFYGKIVPKSCQIFFQLLVGIWALTGENENGECVGVCEFSEAGILRYYEVEGAVVENNVLNVKSVHWDSEPYYETTYILDNGQLYAQDWVLAKVAKLQWISANEVNLADAHYIEEGKAYRLKGIKGISPFVEFEIKISSSGSTGGHDYVDLGLPSGTLWATCNVGADSPEAYGDYFAWGETTPKSDYSWSTYKYGTAEDQLTKYCNKGSSGKNGFTDNKTVLDAEDDAATANWGDEWRMPTGEELAELYDGCIKIWTTQQGVKGRIFIGLNGNTLFLPAAGIYGETSLYSAGSGGNYWSSSLYTGDPYSACYLYFFSDYVSWNYDYRCYGLSVRPVVK